MAIEVVMPRLGWNMEAGTVVEWLKHDGDPVKAGEYLFLVESDKATTEVESLDSGILRIPDNALRVGEEVPVGTVLAYLVRTERMCQSAAGTGSSPQQAVATRRHSVSGVTPAVDGPRHSSHGQRHAGRQPARDPRRRGTRRGLDETDRHGRRRPHRRAGCARGVASRTYRRQPAVPRRKRTARPPPPLRRRRQCRSARCAASSASGWRRARTPLRRHADD